MRARSNSNEALLAGADANAAEAQPTRLARATAAAKAAAETANNFTKGLLGHVYGGDSWKQIGLNFAGLPNSWQKFVGWNGYNKTSNKIANAVAVPFAIVWNTAVVAASLLTNTAKLLTEVLPASITIGFNKLSEMGKGKLYGVPSFVADVLGGVSKLAYRVGLSITSPVKGYQAAKKDYGWAGAAASVVSSALGFVVTSVALTAATLRVVPATVFAPIGSLINRFVYPYAAPAIDFVGNLFGMQVGTRLVPATLAAQGAAIGANAAVNATTSRVNTFMAKRDAAAPVVANPEADKAAEAAAPAAPEAKAEVAPAVKADAAPASVATNPATIAGAAKMDAEAAKIAAKTAPVVEIDARQAVSLAS